MPANGCAVQVELQVPTLPPWEWNSPTCRVLTFPKVDLPALALSDRVVPRHPSTSLGRHNRLAAAKNFAFLLCVCVRACMGVRTCMYVRKSQHGHTLNCL